MDKLYNVGAYIRLSIEDSAYDSDSVEHQREMLSKFINIMPGWIEYRFYVDNGFSGSTFDRPAFQEMMQDVREGHVDLVLVKDLSRFGRNYLEAGRYLEEELPALGCRFVALGDNVDTESGENDIIPFLNAMNDFYLKNLSDRIRSVLHAKAQDGQKLGSVPYGYHRDPEHHNRLILDDYAAGVVRRIFEMRALGTGYPTISKTLNIEGVLPPRRYYFAQRGWDDSQIRGRQWITSTVSMLLRRELYIGTAEQLVNKVVSYRDQRQIKRPVEERVRVENAFPAIVDQETWDVVQEVNRQAKEKSSGRRKPRKSLFSGLLVCADCGVALTHFNSPKTYKSGKLCEYSNYQCRTFQATGGVSCSKHYIREATLKKVVLEYIHQLAEQIMLDEDAMLQLLTERLAGGEASSKVAAVKEQQLLRQQLQKLDAAAAQLYEDRLTGAISEDAFLDMLQKREAERLEKEQRLSLLEQSEEEVAKKLADVQHWMRLIRERASLKDVDRETLEALVERIEIGEHEIVDGEKRQDIRIVYKYVCCLGGGVDG